MLIKHKKSLGQNFLIDKNIIEKIVNKGSIKNTDFVLEVGPGSGNLTEYILKTKPNKIFVVEKDKKLIEILKKKFSNQITIIENDILKVSENTISNNQLIVFGNLPYNISTKILTKWILSNDKKYWYKNLILMFQKEVADRILAKVNSKNYGRLSIVSNWKLKIEKIMDISPTCFYPKPKIESTLLKFTPKAKFFLFNNPKNLETITRIFFSQRRKKIRSSFKKIFGKNYENVSNELSIDLNLRPQNLDTETYYEITKQYEKLRS